MGKIALWILVVVAVMLLVRMIGPAKRRTRDEADPAVRSGANRAPGKGAAEKEADEKEADKRGSAGELMMGCSVCGVHVPSSDAVFAHGRVYCGPEHRDEDEARGMQSKGSQKGTQDKGSQDKGSQDKGRNGSARGGAE